MLLGIFCVCQVADSSRTLNKPPGEDVKLTLSVVFRFMSNGNVILPEVPLTGMSNGVMLRSIKAALTSVFITPTMPNTIANAKTTPVNFLIFVIVDLPPCFFDLPFP
jgi:hypothetical protein